MKRSIPSTLSLLLAGSLSACFAGGGDSQRDEQQLRGHIPLDRYAAEVIGVRVVANGQAVSSAKTDALGNFNIGVPRGQNYSFEIVTKDGSRTVLTGPLDGVSPTNFDVCDPGADFDLGEINPFDFEEIDGDEQPWSHTDDDCSVPPWICEELGPDGGPIECWDVPLPCDDANSDPSFCWDEPLPCDDPASDPSFCWDDTEPCNSMDPDDCQPYPPEPCNSMDPDDCQPYPPEPCNSMDPDDCQPYPPEPCMDPNDPWCLPPEPCNSMDPADCDPWIPDPCDDMGSGWDPMCEDPQPGDCMGGYDDPSCWPQPDVCIMTPDGGFAGCDDQTGGAPEFPFPDFGCEAQ